MVICIITFRFFKNLKGNFLYTLLTVDDVTELHHVKDLSPSVLAYPFGVARSISVDNR